MTLTALVLACFTSLGGLNPTVQANQTRGIRRNAENILMNSSDVTYDEDYPLTIDDQIAVFGNRFYRFSQQNNLLDSELMTRLSNVVPQENGEYYRLDYSPLPNMSDYEYESENRDVFYNNLFINPIFGHGLFNPGEHAPYAALNLFQGDSLYERLLTEGFRRIPGSDVLLPPHTTYDLVIDDDFYDYISARGYERIPFPGGDVLLPPHVTYDLSIVDLYDYLRTRGYERIPGGDALLPPHVVLNAIGYASYNERLRLGTYDPELVGIEINGELNGNPFAGINVSKDTCIALYNCVATWFNSFEENSFGVVGGDFAAQFDCPWGWSFSEWFNEAIYMLTEIGPWDRAAAVKTINDSYNGVWEELLPLLSRVNDIGAVVDFVIELAGTSSIGILAMMIVSGALGEDCVVGWAFSNEPNANSFVCSPFGDLLD